METYEVEFTVRLRINVSAKNAAEAKKKTPQEVDAWFKNKGAKLNRPDDHVNVLTIEKAKAPVVISRFANTQYINPSKYSLRVKVVSDFAMKVMVNEQQVFKEVLTASVIVPPGCSYRMLTNGKILSWEETEMIPV